LLPTLQSLLEQAGGSLTYRNGIFRISTAGDGAVVPPVVRDVSPGAGTQVVPLHFASAKQLATVLEPYIGDAAKIFADSGRNVLIVTGSASARQGAIDLVDIFDVDYLAGQSYALFPAKTGDPRKLAADLEAALQLGGDGPISGALKIVPILAANAVMAIAQQPSYLDRVSRLVAQLDRVTETAGRTIHVYYLKNVQATDLQPLLQRAVNPPAGGGGGGGEIGPGNLPPTAVPVQINGPPTQAPTPANSQAPTMGFPAAGLPRGAGQPPPLVQSEAAAPSAAGANANGPQIVADRTNGALIIVATESEYATIEAAIRKLDVLPMQVMIEATIAEVTLNNMLQYGTQFFLSNNTLQATLSNAASPLATAIDSVNPAGSSTLFSSALTQAVPGLAVARTIGQQQFALQALKSITDVQIISAPKLLILDKQQARLQVGDLVPIITQSATSVITAGAPVVNNVQYQATGVILTVTPHINAGGLVTLDIEQEVSDVVPTTSSSINSPTFQQRKVETKVVVQDGETISLAGMISDKKTKGNSGIPIVQDIPVLGALFATKTNSTERTELLVLLTPRVLTTVNDARELTDELRRKLAPSNLVP
jgi:general secretion pathway protein D